MEQTFFPVTENRAKRSGIQRSSEKNKNAGFPSVLRGLRKKKGVSQETVSKELGISKSTLGLWETGDTLPDAKAVYDLSAYYGVSTDYLLGKTDIPAISMKVAEICKYTGLTEYTVSTLNMHATIGKTMSSFLARFFEDFVVSNEKCLDKINTFLVNAAQADAIDETMEPEADVEIENIIDAMNGTHKGYYKISSGQAKWYFLAQAKELARGSIDVILENMEEELCREYTSMGFVSQTPQEHVWALIEDEK